MPYRQQLPPNYRNAPPPELIQGLPGNGIALPKNDGKPLPLLQDHMVGRAIKEAKLGVAAQVVAESHPNAEDFFWSLLDINEPLIAMRFMAWSLPKREGLWWAFRCCWDVLLDRDRANYEKWNKPESPATPTPPESSGGMSAEHSAKIEELNRAASELESKAAAGQQDLMAKLKDIRSHLQAEITQSAESRGGASAQPPAISRLKRLRAHHLEMASYTPPKQVNIEITSPKDRPPKASSRSRTPEPMSPVMEQVWRRRVELRMQAMASSLQWVLDPCHENAIKAGEAAKSMEGDPFAKALARSAFWCGESLEADPKKAKVPPPETLPHRGIEGALTKGLGHPNAAWSRQDRVHWFLHRGLLVSSGQLPWDGSLDDFNTYITHMLGNEV